MQQLANSPDFNLIENLQYLFKKHFHKWFINIYKVSSQFKEAIQQYSKGLKQAWLDIRFGLMKQLVESILDRIQAVIDARCRPTKY